MDAKEKKRTINIFAWSSFLNDFGSDMIYPVWPLFVTTVLGADMAVLGFIDGLGEALVSISQAVSGYVSDRIKRRKVFVWTGYLCSSLSRLGYGLSTVWQMLIPFKILDRSGKMRGAPRDAIIADISTQKDRGRNFGYVRTMDNLGAVFGIIACIFLINKIGYRDLFIIAAIPSLIGALMIFLKIKERKVEGIKVFKGLKLNQLDRNFRLFLFINAIFSLGSFSYSFLLIYAKNFHFTTTFIPVLYLVFTLVASMFSFPFGRLSDRIGRKNVLIIAFFFWALTCVIFILLNSKLTIFLAFIFYGLHKAALEPVQKTFVAELAPAEFRASSLGGFQMVVGLCALPASLIAGLLWDKINIFAPFYFSLALTVIAIFLLMFVKKQ